MQPTYRDIQEKTGLSLSTISKYMNGGPVRPANRKAIDKAIKELDYHVNAYAQSLRSRRSKTIALLIPELESTFHTTIMGHVARILRHEGFACLICSCDMSKTIEQQSISFAIEKMVDGIITIPYNRTGKQLEKAVKRDIPVVLVDRQTESFKSDCVTIDNYGAGTIAAEYLYENGHRDIAIISGPQSVYTMAGRTRGFVDYLKEKNCLRREFIVETEFSIGGGYEATIRMFGKAKVPTALFCPNYEITLGTVMAMSSLGIKYPDDTSLLGFDNMFLSDIIRPRLSMITQPMEEIAAAAARLMLDKLAGKSTGLHQVELPVSLFRGESVKNLALETAETAR